MTFEDLRLNRPLLDAVRSAGYETPTPIQAEVIPLILDGKDVIACAQTGTGKTAAFGVAMIERIDWQVRHVQGLVLTPTRELALQVADDINSFAKYTPLRATVITGLLGSSLVTVISVL